MTKSESNNMEKVNANMFEDILKRVKKLPQTACSMCGKKWLDWQIKQNNGVCPDCVPRRERLRLDDIPMLYRECTFENFKTYNEETTSALAKAKNFLKDNRGLFLAGNVGSGKTHLAFAIMKEIKKLEGTYKYINAAELALELKTNTFGENHMTATYANTHWLIIDDLGASSLNDKLLDLLYRILERRINRMYNRTLIISNLKLSDASGQFQALDQIDTRIASRITTFDVAYLFGKDTVDMRFKLRKK